MSVDAAMPACAPAAPQREAPVAAAGRIHGKSYQSAVRVGHLRRPERQLYAVLLTPDGDWVASLLRRLLAGLSNSHSGSARDSRAHELTAEHLTPKVGDKIAAFRG